MTAIDPEHAAEISKGLADYSKMIHSKPLHPTQTTRGSVWIDHANGTTSHWQVRRPKTLAEVRRAQRRGTVEAGRKVQAGLWFRLGRALGLLR